MQSWVIKDRALEERRACELMILLSLEAIRRLVRVHERSDCEQDKGQRESVRGCRVAWRRGWCKVLIIEVLEDLVVKLGARDWVVPSQNGKISLHLSIKLELCRKWGVSLYRRREGEVDRLKGKSTNIHAAR